MLKSGSRQQAIIFLVLAAILWSSSGLLVKVISWGPLSILSARSMGATLVFLLYLRKLDWHWTKLEVLGAVSYVAAQLLFITATKLTTAANAIFLQYTAPLYIGILSYWWLKERPTRADWIAMGFIFLGLLLFFGDKLQPTGLIGNIVAIVSGVALAMMTLSLRAQKSKAPAQAILLGNLIGIVVGLPWLVQEKFTPADLGIITYLGLFQIGLSFVLYTIAIKRVRALESTLIITLEPILSPVWVFLFLHEVPGPWAIVGCLVVAVAVTVAAIRGARAGEEEPPAVAPEMGQ
jgi:drug/metabolite transporter (DMT)-like permease